MTDSAAARASSKYRHIRGGLDNAVRQAEERHLNDLFIVDVDCHQGEPFTLFEKYIPQKYRRDYSNEKLLAAAMNEEGSKAQSSSRQMTMSNLLSVHHGSTGYDRSLGGRIRRPELRTEADLRRGGDATAVRDQSPEEVVDTFVGRMSDIGIKRCIIFPNSLFALGGHPDFELEVALNTAYNDYMVDKFLGKFPEILSCIATPANSPQKAAEMIDRYGSVKGHVGISITPCRPTLAGDPSWDPIYDAAERKGLPIVLHGETGKGPLQPLLDRFEPGCYLPVHALGFTLSLIGHLISIVVSGVPERFPKLKFVFMEGGLTWIPWMMHRLDSEYMMRKSEAPLLTRMPSEYIKEFYFSQQPLEFTTPTKELEQLFCTIKADTQLVYASDYPHWDFEPPSLIYDLPFLSAQTKKDILSENALRVFKIDR